MGATTGSHDGVPRCGDPDRDKDRCKDRDTLRLQKCLTILANPKAGPEVSAPSGKTEWRTYAHADLKPLTLVKHRRSKFRRTR
eukprot:7838710-Pyramimonas_sp.AAC.1